MEISPIQHILIGVEEEDGKEVYIPTVWLGEPDSRILELDRCATEIEANQAVERFLDLMRVIAETQEPL